MDELSRFESQRQSIHGLVACVKRYEAELLKKREEISFLQRIITEKQRQCQVLKENHEKRIKALSRQARRQRSRSVVREDGSAVTFPSAASARSEDQSLSASPGPVSTGAMSPRSHFSKREQVPAATSPQVSAKTREDKRNELLSSLDFHSLGKALGPLSTSTEMVSENPEDAVSLFTKLLQQKMEEICSVRNRMDEYCACATASKGPEDYFALEREVAEVLLAAGR
eukprot:TRINITY_DN67987_c0_g1_i1.p1 TRINITY_DN67987_c0_g1~~TRINITY_DN67987_c0_g1_i1.p1  ORF type:complete len:227 (-),score=41.81 TRINITY_DN67987_c0_g1_i1:146-826(-)